MKKILIIVLLIQITGCSTLKKSVTFGGITGGTVGALAGSAMSPDSYSKAPNALIWGGIGAIAGAALGYYFFNEDPANKELPSMILDESPKTVDEIENTHILMPKISNKYVIDKGTLPENLRDKVPTPILIEHVIPERKNKMQGNRTITIDEHKAYEIIYE